MDKPNTHLQVLQDPLAQSRMASKLWASADYSLWQAQLDTYWEVVESSPKGHALLDLERCGLAARRGSAQGH